MVAQYKVEFTAEIITTVTVTAVSEDAAFDVALDALAEDLKGVPSPIASLEILEFDITENLHKIH